MNLMLGAQSGEAVRCSAWLGVIDPIAVSLLGGALLIELWVLTSAILVITQINREKKQGDGKTNYPPSKRNQRVGLPLQSLRRLLLLFGYDNQQPRKASGNLQLTQGRVRHVGLRKLFHLPNKIISLVCHKRVMTPNDPSSATRRTGRNDCNRDAPAGLDAMMG